MRIASRATQRSSGRVYEHRRGFHEECVPLAIWVFSRSFTRHVEDDTSGAAILSKIAHRGCQINRPLANCGAGNRLAAKVSNTDQTFAYPLCDHDK
jgi:hypothetical protein